MEHRTLESLKVEAQILAAVLDKVHLTWQPWPEHQEKAITRVRALLNTANDAIEERTLWPYKVTYVAFGYRYSLRCGNWRAARRRWTNAPIIPHPCGPSLVCAALSMGGVHL